ncbi:hypothetical protein JW998_12865 [candidate division KSB1 bacterium]|nr:hypothetical protein [candidate division KSB1 bacterium]
MDYDEEKVDEMVLALLHLTSSRDQYATRAWKGFDLRVMDRLYQKGYIGDPRGKSASLLLTEAGAKLSEELFCKYFVKKDGKNV